MINLNSPSCTTTSVLICDFYKAPEGSIDSVPTLTISNGQPVSAALEIQSTQGSVLLPRLNQAEIENLNSVDGMILYNSTIDFFQIRQAGGWDTIGSGDVTGPTVANAGNIAIFEGPSGKVILDSGVNISQVPPLDFLKFSEKSLERESVTNVIQLENLGILKFINGVGLVFVDNLSPITFYELGGQISTIITSGGAALSGPTTESCAFEIQSTTGGLVLSRMTTNQMNNLSATDGMTIFNTDYGQPFTYHNNQFSQIQTNGLTIVDLGTGSYNASLSDDVISVNNSIPNSFQEVILPASPDYGAQVKVVDSTGNAGTDTIFANGNGNYINSNSVVFQKNIPVGSEPTVMAITPNGKYLYISDLGTASISIIENASSISSSFLKTILVGIGSAPSQMIITPDGNYLYSIGSDTALLCFSNVSTSPPDSYHSYLLLPNIPVSMALTPNGQYLYITYTGTNPTNGQIYIIGGVNTGSPYIYNTISIQEPDGVAAISMNSDGDYALIGDELSSHFYYFQNVSTGSDVWSYLFLSGTSPPGFIALTSFGGYGYACGVSTDQIIVVQGLGTNSPSQNTIINTGLSNPSNILLITPNDQYVYAGGWFSGYISIIQDAIGTPTLLKNIYIGAVTVTSLSISPNGNYVYVTDNAGNVTIIQNASNTSINNPTILTVIPAGNDIFSSQITPNGNYLYNSNQNENTISIIKNASSGVQSSIPSYVTETIDNNVNYMAFSADGTIGYCVGPSDHVSIIENASTASPLISTSLTLSGMSAGISTIFSPTNPSFAFVLGIDSGNISHVYVIQDVNIGFPSLLSSIGLGSENSSGGLAITPNGNYVYATNSAGYTLNIIHNASSGSPGLLTTISIGSSASILTNVFISPNGNFAYASNYSNNTLYLVQNASTETPSLVTTITVGANPKLALFTNDGNYLYVLNYGDGSVSVIQNASSTSASLLTNITVGSSPLYLVMTPNQQYCYVSCAGSSNIYQIGGVGSGSPSVTSIIDVGLTVNGGLSISSDGNYLYAGTNSGIHIIGGASSVNPYVTNGIVNGVNSAKFFPTPGKQFIYAGTLSSTTILDLYNMNLDYPLITSNFGSSTIIFDGSQWIASAGM